MGCLVELLAGFGVATQAGPGDFGPRLERLFEFLEGGMVGGGRRDVGPGRLFFGSVGVTGEAIR